MGIGQQDEEAMTRRQAEIALLKRLGKASFYANRPPGVLLSDWIRHYVDRYDLIRPFEEKQLKRAGYELSVGSIFSVGGQTHEIADQPGQNELRIEPFEVAIVQTRERLNMPDFLIGRWNIRVRHAYQGLLWVGGPQVDPGYQGFLCCPIYNLSDQPVTLRFGEELALIDFQTTTPPTQSTIPYPAPDKRSRLLFEDYSPDKLQSALATRAEKRIDQIETKVEDIRTRFTTYTQLTFAILAPTIAAISLSLGKSPSFGIWNPTALLVVGVLFISLLALYEAKVSQNALIDADPKSKKNKTPKMRLLRFAAYFIVFSCALYGVYGLFVLPLQKRVDALKQEIDQMKSSKQVVTSDSQSRRGNAGSTVQPVQSTNQAH